MALKALVMNRLSVGLREALRRLRHESRMMMLHRRGVRMAARYRRSTGLKLHLGCGGNLKPGFINIDLSAAADLPLDLREPLPFEKDCCAFIYSEHFLEHLDYPEAVHRFLGECLRVLEPGGVFSAGVPDTEWPLKEYAGVTREGYFDLAKARWHPSWCETRLDHINFQPDWSRDATCSRRLTSTKPARASVRSSVSKS